MGNCNSQPLSKVKNTELLANKKPEVQKEKPKKVCAKKEDSEPDSEQKSAKENIIIETSRDQSRPYFSFNAFFYQNEKPQIFDWLFLQELCNGTTSQIYLVKNVETQAVCVAKVYNNSILYRQPLGNEIPPIDSFNKEIDVMCQLTYLHIMSYHEMVDDQMTNSKILVLPYASLGNLKTAMSNNQISYENLIVCWYQIAGALDYMHSHGLAHRDVCPENILVFVENYFCIHHFKSVTKVDSPDLSRTFGTFRFLAPEELNGKTYDVRKSDVWELGITIYWAFFRKKPFDLDIVQIDDKPYKYDKLYQHIMQKPLEIPKIDSISTEITDLLSTMLEKDPDKRPNFATILESHVLMMQEYSTSMIQ
ncbi:CAMK family protein kinase [Trichomonas vaginalis G3]|uniref:CAMK family protein kinase n=1 Tax=Trichomonas vaginalis (strain ATCC PRA-98 / G3) TaxID=412133 RepID=A2DYL5_TRIV3|nr:protein serine/threonine kinase protein [Trichomonas vaginalis G3]EAY14550.1 CAMK family protein kinase [Trichomonas vaginalis G3]KAI5529282.1 protein serine/threonine kinase protein [Trichomonas vaginalis G3]|eukprot:XP_001326773.1 CAMK family protein kinase [Trichomonas vaginalis G3]